MHEAVWSREDALAFLESPARKESENPQELWTRVGLTTGMTVVDVGAGTGYFAFPAAEIVGPSGGVVAVDISPELVELMHDRVRESGLRNVSVVRSTPKRIPLPGGRADRVLLANLLHGLPASTVAEAVRLLRPGGQLINEDWAKRPTEGGPPVEVRLSESEAARVLQQFGLEHVSHGRFGPSHYLVTMARPSGPSARRKEPRSKLLRPARG